MKAKNPKLRVETVPVDALRPYDNNAKIHTPEQIEQIKKSILEFGFNDPIAIDEDNMVIEGHGRLLAVKELGWKEVEAIRLHDLSDEQKRAYILVHNQLTLNTGFDLDMLQIELANITDLDMGEFGFDLDLSIDTKMDFGEDKESESEPQVFGEPKVKRGQVWKCGNHRLMCGSSTDKKDVKKLLDGATMDMCVTDPPYNVGYHSRDGKTIKNDNLEEDEFSDFLKKFYGNMLFSLKPGGAFYIWHPSGGELQFESALIGEGAAVRTTLIWVKNVFAAGWGDYRWKHEPCFYGWKDGAEHYFIDSRKQSTVFEQRPDFEAMGYDELLKTAESLYSEYTDANSTVIHEDKPLKSDIHPTMKPVKLFERLILNSSRRGENVIDFFGGSGTTLIACEHTGRNAYVMELDETYCSVALSRWEEETGQKGELVK